jgi:hypothetical protein
MKMSSRALCAIATVAASSLRAPAAWSSTFQDVLVQPPSLAQPQRGSLAGTLSRTTFGAGDLARGAYKLPLAVDAPSERGRCSPA